jgi:hypothetical protein
MVAVAVIGKPGLDRLPRLIIDEARMKTVMARGLVADPPDVNRIIEFLEVEPDATAHLIDCSVRVEIAARQVQAWLASENLSSSTPLTWLLDDLLDRHERVLLLTDGDGAGGLSHFRAGLVEVGDPRPEAKLLGVRRVRELHSVGRRGM